MNIYNNRFVIFVFFLFNCCSINELESHHNTILFYVLICMDYASLFFDALIIAQLLIEIEQLSTAT